jgi:hypothetical protein
MEKELCVTSHEYLLKGSPFTWSKKRTPVEYRSTTKWLQRKKGEITRGKCSALQWRWAG